MTKAQNEFESETYPSKFEEQNEKWNNFKKFKMSNDS